MDAELTTLDYESRSARIRASLAKIAGPGSKSKAFIKLFMQTMGSALSAAQGGMEAMLYSVAGGAVSNVAGILNDAEQSAANALFAECLQNHEDKFQEIIALVFDVTNRVALEDEPIKNRAESREYQSLIAKAFSDRAAYETNDKREQMRKLLTNASVPGVLPDDLIRLFIQWHSQYSDLHFKIIRHIRTHPMSTRADIWESLHGENVRENSAEADLFAVLIMDLSFGHVIRQYRPTDSAGNFLKQTPKPRTKTRQMTSRFDDDKSYQLTELGDRFIHYVMDELVKKLPSPS